MKPITMESRSFKPASYLTSQLSTRSPRPSLTRSSSASSIKSYKSEDSFVATSRNLAATDNNSTGREKGSTGSLPSTGGGASPRCSTPVDGPSLPRQVIDDTPGRKRSQPIAIELPSRIQAVYTPLSARGDLPGGYFPNHETLPKAYKPYPFSRNHSVIHDGQKSTSQPSSPSSPLSPSSPYNMSNASSTMASPSGTTLRAPSSILTPTLIASFPVSEVPTMPMGKYHPANYKAPAKASLTLALSLPPTNTFLPPSVPDRKKSRPGHIRHGSDVRRKVQEYQMGQARNAQMLASAHGGSKGSNPISPRLAPLGSPGPITPFELEESPQSGYIVAGAMAARGDPIGRGLERERDRELVGQMIKVEEERRAMGGKGGSHSPILRV